MCKLLFAQFSRLKKNKVFLGEVVFMWIIGAFLAANQYFEQVKYGYDMALDNIFFGYSLITGILMAVFSTIFLGTEYSDGTIRNKLIVGHSRLDIYLSNLIVNLSVSFLFCLSFIAGVSIVGIPLIGFLETEFKIILIFFIGTLALSMAYSSIYTMLSMICSNKTAVAVISILGVVLLLTAATWIQSRLNLPEFYNGYSLTESGQIMEPELIPNPHYLKGAKRKAYQFIIDFLPTGQSLQYCSMMAVHPLQMPLYSLFIAFISSITGIMIFKQKDLQ